MKNQSARSSTRPQHLRRPQGTGGRIAWLALIFSVATAPLDSVFGASEALLNQQRMLLVHGQPRFIIGLYENPKADAVIEEAVAAGFNLIQCAPDTAELDRVQRFGAKAWVNVGSALDLSEDTANRRQKLTELATRLSQHPALLVWEGPDEILWNTWYEALEQRGAELDTLQPVAKGKPELEALSRRARDRFERGLYAQFEQTRDEFWQKTGQPAPPGAGRLDDAPARVRKSGAGVTAGIKVLRETDARHVIWLNHAPRNSLADLRLYNCAVDMAGCDIYPAPANLAVGHSDLVDLGLTSVGAYTERMRQAAPGKACAMVLQGFGWRDLEPKVNEPEIAVGIGRRPTWAESRFMAYDAILHGANAILYWGTANLKPVENDGSPANGRPRFWQDLLRVTREIHALEPALVAPPLKSPHVRQAETCGSIDGQGMRCLLRRAAEDYVLIVINETVNRLQFTIENLPAKLNGRTLYRLYAAEEPSVTGRRLVDGMKSKDVQVYATSRRFEDPLARRQ